MFFATFGFLKIGKISVFFKFNWEDWCLWITHCLAPRLERLVVDTVDKKPIIRIKTIPPIYAFLASDDVSMVTACG